MYIYSMVLYITLTEEHITIAHLNKNTHNQLRINKTIIIKQS